jgi:hypothetical protein
MLGDDILHHRDESAAVSTIALEVLQLSGQGNGLGILLRVY